jgi:CBS domain-containing protein
MALKRNEHGEYILTSKKQVVAALKLMDELAADISELMDKYDIHEMMQDSTELKRAAERYLIENEIDELPIEGGKRAKLIRGGYDRRWILTSKEDVPKGAVPLRTLLKKKLKPAEFKEVMNRITIKVVNPAEIDEIVAEGIVTEKDIKKAFVEKEKKPYMRIYDQAAEDDEE